jgi:dTDP-4-dehydrorhamnose reductase
MTHAILLGHDGMVGTAFSQLLGSADGVRLTPVGMDTLDFADPDSLARFTAAGADVVICCAAYTNVDGAEEHEALATQINGEAVGTIARRCADAGATLIHFSTDYVFDGHGSEPYPVDAPIAPLNAYGRSKAVGEKLLRESGADHLLLRTSWVYAPWGKNFVRTMARLTREKDELKVVDDQRGRPTSAEHLAKTAWALYRKRARGFFHATDGGECTWHDLAEAVREIQGAECAIARCTTEEFPLPAVRPPYSVLDLSATEAIVGPMPHWRENLAHVMARLPLPDA